MSNQTGLIEVEVNRLKLDEANPRLPSRLIGQGEKEVLEWMLTDATLTDLMASIVENGFFGGEALIGIEDEKVPGTFIIVEGNRRLAAIKLLHNPQNVAYKSDTVRALSEQIKLANKLPNKLPVYVVSSRSDVQNYLGFRHVTGVKQWPVIAKARYIHLLYSDINKNGFVADVYKKIAREIGSKSNYVRRLVIGYQLFEKIVSRNYYDLDYLSEDSFDLSRINDAATMHPAIELYMGIQKNEANAVSSLKEIEFENVFRWLYEKDKDGVTRVGDSRNLSILNKVLETPIASEKFIQEGLSLGEAAEYTDLVNDTLRGYLSTAKANMAEAQKMIHRVVNPTTYEVNLAKEIEQSASAILAALRFNQSR